MMYTEERVTNSIKFYNKVQKLSKKESIKIGKFIGMGCMGAVFSYGKQKIIKFTTDPNEAAYCQYVLDLKIKTTPIIYKVEKLDKIWIIVQEKLEALDKKKDISIYNIFSDQRKTISLQKLIKDFRIKSVYDFKLLYNLPTNKTLTQLVEKILSMRNFAYPDIKRPNVLKKKKEYYFIDCKINDDSSSLEFWLKRISKFNKC